MTPGGDVAVILLAAGRSTRFDEVDKLWALLGDRSLIDHAAAALRGLDSATRIAVLPAGRSAPEGFMRIENSAPQAGQSRSLALGVRAAREAGARAVIVTLADMPFVSTRHLRAMLALCDGPAALAASTCDGTPMPPALFGSAWFDALEQQDGDRGARALLHRARLVRTTRRELTDVDTMADLSAAARVLD